MKRLSLILVLGFLSWFASAQHVNYDRESLFNIEIDEDCVLPPFKTDYTICENTAANLDIPDGDYILSWYVYQDGEWQYVADGFDYVTDNLFEFSKYKVKASCPSQVVESRSLATTMIGDNGKEGVMFKLAPNRDITLSEIGVHAVEGDIHARVYFIEGDYFYQMSNPNAWSKIFEGDIHGQGKYNIVSIDVNDISLEADSVYGIYVTLDNQNVIYYETGIGSFQNEDLMISQTTGVSYPFQYFCGNRRFNGKVFYTLPQPDLTEDYFINVDVVKQPIPPVVMYYGEQLEVVNSEEANLRWFLNDHLIPDVDSVVYIPQEEGYYSAKFSVGECESDLSNEYYFGSTGIEELPNIYPNPFSSDINISVEDSNLEWAEQIEIYNASGKLVHSTMFKNNLMLRELPEGVYFIHIHGNGMEYKQPIIKLE